MAISITKSILFIAFLAVFIQDIKERQVSWFLFPIIALCSGVLQYKNIALDILIPTLLINASFISLLLFVVFCYAKLKLKTNINGVFGLGDGLLFFALVFTFSTIPFIILFVFALIFSLVLHLLIKEKTVIQTVPLAGYMSLFFAITYLSHWFGFTHSIYTF